MRGLIFLIIVSNVFAGRILDQLHREKVGHYQESPEEHAQHQSGAELFEKLVSQYSNNSRLDKDEFRIDVLEKQVKNLTEANRSLRSDFRKAEEILETQFKSIDHTLESIKALNGLVDFMKSSGIGMLILTTIIGGGFGGLHIKRKLKNGNGLDIDKLGESIAKAIEGKKS